MVYRVMVTLSGFAYPTAAPPPSMNTNIMQRSNQLLEYPQPPSIPSYTVIIIIIIIIILYNIISIFHGLLDGKLPINKVLLAITYQLKVNKVSPSRITN